MSIQSSKKNSSSKAKVVRNLFLFIKSFILCTTAVVFLMVGPALADNSYNDENIPTVERNECSQINEYKDGSNIISGKKAIQEAIKNGKLQHIFYKGDTLVPEDGFKFKTLKVVLPDGSTTKRFQLFSQDDIFSEIELACSCDGFSSSEGCTQIGSSPFGIVCGGFCNGCQAYVLFVNQAE